MGFSLQCTVTRVDPEDHQRLRNLVYKTSKGLDALRLKYGTFVHNLFPHLRPLWAYIMYEYTVKKASDFPVPSRDVTKQTLTGGE